MSTSIDVGVIAEDPLSTSTNLGVVVKEVHVQPHRLYDCCIIMMYFSVQGSRQMHLQGASSGALVVSQVCCYFFACPCLHSCGKLYLRCLHSEVLLGIIRSL